MQKISKIIVGCRFICGLLIIFSFIGLPALAESWPKLESVLDEWQGGRQIVLRSDLADPLASPEVQRLLEFLLERGFAVIPASLGTGVRDGLIIDLRTATKGSILALSHAPDGVILALDRVTWGEGDNEGKVVSRPSTRKAPGEGLNRKRLPEERELLRGPLELSGSPRRLAVISGSSSPELLLLFDRSLVHYRFSGRGLEKIESFSPALSPSKGLHVEAADLDDDGREEIAAVWAEEVGEIYGGMDARIHSWIISAGGGLRPESPDLEGYLQLLPQGGFWQGRGKHQPFAGPVLPLEWENKKISIGTEMIPYRGRFLYHSTPIGEGEGVTWDGADRLSLVRMTTGEPVPGGALLEGLGPFCGPEVAVSKEEPEYRTGLERADRIWESYHPLPRRIIVEGEGVFYTIRRGRTGGLPLVGRPSGHDEVIRITRTDDGLRLDRPFDGVDAFIIDFALLRREGRAPAAVLLLNEKADGVGKAWLLVQEVATGL